MSAHTEPDPSSALIADAISSLELSESETLKQPPGLTIRKKGDTVIRPKS